MNVEGGSDRKVKEIKVDRRRNKNQWRQALSEREAEER